MTMFVLLFGAALVAVGVYMRHAANRGRDWPTASATILERSAIDRHDKGRFAAQLKYAYKLGGKDYVGERIYLVGGPTGSQSAMQELVDGLPNPLPIRYDPDDPAVAFVMDVPAWGFWLPLAMGAMLLLVGALRLFVTSGAKAPP